MRKIAIVLTLTILQTACAGVQLSTSNATVKKACGTTRNCFEQVQAAINAAPDNSAAPYRIYIANGDWQEKILISKNNLQLIGRGSAKTRLVFGDYAGKEMAPGKTLSTPGSATLTIRAKDVALKALSVENSFDFLANDALASDNPKRINGSQAVAVFIDAPSDRVLVRDVTMLGYQDTLFVNSGRSWFDKVLVAGNVDYIFGNGNALFTQSEIKTLARGKANNPHGFITAPSTQIASHYGFTFVSCRLTRDSSVANNSVPLGRPWHPTTSFPDGRYADPNAIGKSVFINTWMDAHITQDGWYSMGGTAKEGGKKSFLPEDARFFEFNSSGPGSYKTPKRRELEADAAKGYTKQQILGDWEE